MPDVATTWAECLHEWRAEGKGSPIIDLAFSAVTLSVFASFQKCRPAAAEASKSYLSLLRHMQDRIPRLNSGSPSSDEIDEYLLAAHLMARYEAFVQNHGDEADLEPLKEVKFIDLHHKYLELKQSSQSGTLVAQKVDNLIDDFRILDQDIQTWAARLPSKWSYSQHILPETCDFSQDEFYSKAVSTCAKLGYTAVWNEHYAIRMFISHTRLQILHLAPQPNPAETHEYLSQLGSSADSLASFVPFCLGRIRKTPKGSVELSDEPFKPYLASLVVWPLSLASGLHTLEPAQRQWFSSTVARVSEKSSECLYAYAASDYWAVP
ncbi:hypothetical protein Neosp_005174 [[Neocosmospora] mangrovei]